MSHFHDKKIFSSFSKKASLSRFLKDNPKIRTANALLRAVHRPSRRQISEQVDPEQSGRARRGDGHAIVQRARGKIDGVVPGDKSANGRQHRVRYRATARKSGRSPRMDDPPLLLLLHQSDEYFPILTC